MALTFFLMTLLTAMILAFLVIRKAFYSVNMLSNDSKETLTILNDQLREVASDVNRGLVTESEGEISKNIISRKIITTEREAKERLPMRLAPKRANLLFSIFTILVLIFGSFFIYIATGMTGIKFLNQAEWNRPDNTFTQLSQEQAEIFLFSEAENESNKKDITPNYKLLALIKELKQILVDRPKDLQGHRLLARNSANVGDYATAISAQNRVLLILGTRAEGQDYVALAEYMLFAIKGYVSLEAAEAIKKALSLSPNNRKARYYNGLNLAQNNSPEKAIKIWNKLLVEIPENSALKPLIQNQIEVVYKMVGLQNELPADTNIAIMDMVKNLESRLFSEGGSPEEWQQLIKAYGVLGITGKARETWLAAKKIFSDKPSVMERLRMEASNANVEIQ